MRMAASCRSTRARRGRCRASWRSGRSTTSPTFRRSTSALTKLEGLAPYRQTILAQQARALCRRAGRGGVRVRSVSRRGRRRSGRGRDRGTAGRFSMRARRPASSTTAARPSRRWSRSPTATSPARSARRMRWSNSISRSAGTPACRWRRAARSRATTRRSDMLEMHGAAKVPHWNRDNIARMLGRAPSTVHLFEGHVGGGFGIRGELYPEDVLVCVAALRLRPAGEVDRGPARASDRRQSFAPAASQGARRGRCGRPHPRHRGRVLPRPGRLCAHPRARTVPDLAAAMLPGPYRVPNYRAAGHVRLTNKTPGGTYRAPGRYESTFVRERLMDAIAQRLGIDPVEVRRRNLIAKEEMPYRAAAGHARHRGRARLRRLCAACSTRRWRRVKWSELQREPAARGAPPANRSAPGLRSSSRRAGSGRSTACASRSIRPATSRS